MLNTFLLLSSDKMYGSGAGIHKVLVRIAKKSEYGQEIPQSHIADQPTAIRSGLFV